METKLLVGALLLSCLLLVLLNLHGALHVPTAANESSESPGLRPPPLGDSVGKAPRTKVTSIQKSPFFNQSFLDLQRNSPKSRSVVLIHVGKTGGETVRHTLKITCRMRRNPVQQRACQESFRMKNNTESLLSQHTIGTMHCDLILPQNSVADATTLVWTLRNPLARVESWFYFMNPANCQPDFDYASTACNTNRTIAKMHLKGPETQKGSKWSYKFFGCFRTLEDFALALVPPSFTEDTSNTYSSDCIALAWRTVTGQASASSGHIYFNHQFYWKETLQKYPDKEVWAVRTERLWEDLFHLEELLTDTVPDSSELQQQQQQQQQQASTAYVGMRNVTHGSEGHTHKQRQGLSKVAQERLCCALKDELQTYGRLLLRANNLASTAKQASWDLVAGQCGLSALPLKGDFADISMPCDSTRVARP